MTDIDVEIKDAVESKSSAELTRELIKSLTTDNQKSLEAHLLARDRKVLVDAVCLLRTAHGSKRALSVPSTAPAIVYTVLGLKLPEASAAIQGSKAEETGKVRSSSVTDSVPTTDKSSSGKESIPTNDVTQMMMLMMTQMMEDRKKDTERQREEAARQREEAAKQREEAQKQYERQREEAARQRQETERQYERQREEAAREAARQREESSREAARLYERQLEETTRQLEMQREHEKRQQNSMSELIERIYARDSRDTANSSRTASQGFSDDSQVYPSS